MVNKSLDRWQFGDFQTPDELAQKVVEILICNHHLNPDLIIEPTCGKGSFVRAALKGFPEAKIIGLDINGYYVDKAIESVTCLANEGRFKLIQGDFFHTDWNDLLKTGLGEVLIIGNPPWVTSSELSLLNSKNIPSKSNFQNRRGIEAITGAGNFDISEWMLLKHLNWLTKREGTIAFLCKYSVARKVIKQVVKSKNNCLVGHIYPIDTKLYFGASVEACLFILTTGKGKIDCEVYQDLDSKTPSHLIGERDGFIVKDVKKYEELKHLRGQDSHYIWRSGVKHDCSKVMELEPFNGQLKNGFGKVVNLESNFVYPLLKSSDIGNSRIESYRKVVLITQHFVGEDTSIIKKLAPKTWEYLTAYNKNLKSRKSSIYKNKPPYSIFGVGEYSFKEWKIAISGLYKKLNFCLIRPINNKPVIFDDTVNFLSFDSEAEAKFIFDLITSDLALEFLKSMIFWDNKRPITIDILKRLSIKAIAQKTGVLKEYCFWAKKRQPITSSQLELNY